MSKVSLLDAVKNETAITGLIYCAPGVGKSTSLGILAEHTDGKTLILDVDRTFVNAMKKLEVVKDLSKIDIVQIDNVDTWNDWSAKIDELDRLASEGKLEYDNICVDNISELERCILADLGRKGKNKGVPAMADYQYMQFKLVDSMRKMKSWEKNIYWTAWETIESFTELDGTMYSRRFPKISAKIVDNICGLCDVVARVHVNKDGMRGFVLEATQNAYAKNQIDTRKMCRIEDFLKK